MSQNDLNVTNQNFPLTRADLNNAIQALGSSNSGSTEPPTKLADMIWVETLNDSTSILKIRSSANDAWINIGYLDQTTNAFKVFDDTLVVDTSGTQTGIIGDQATSAWQAGTSNTQSLVSPANVKSSIESSVIPSVGVSQTWSTVTRTRGTTYQNTSGVAVQINVNLRATTRSTNAGDPSPGEATFQVSPNSSTWFTLGSINSQYDREGFLSPVIPNNFYYRWTGSTDLNGARSEAIFTLLS